MKKEDIILHFLHCQTQIRLNHWSTTGDAEHRALGKLYDLLNDFIDEFVETMIGKPEYERPRYQDDFCLGLNDPSVVDIKTYLAQFKVFLYSLSKQLNPVNDTDLLNLRDSILGEVNRTLYFLTLKY